MLMMNGIAAIDKGMVAASGPTVVPRMARVNGINSIIRMINSCYLYWHRFSDIDPPTANTSMAVRTTCPTPVVSTL